MKKEIKVFEYASEVLNGMKSGALLTTKVDEKLNSMTISWGSLGVQWEKPIFIAYVRESRFSKKQLETNQEFTINIPIGSLDKRILEVCGTKSGREVDKIKELGLTPEPPQSISVPGIKELPLTLECRVIYNQKQNEQQIPQEIKKDFYPQSVASVFHGSNKDYHTAFYGEIVSAYIIE